MGCGCNKRNTPSRRTLSPPSVSRNILPQSNAPNPGELRALNMQQAASLSESRRLDEQRLRAEKLRREAIKKRMNK